MSTLDVDLCSTAFLLVVVWLIGAKTVENQPRLQKRGQALALAMFALAMLVPGVLARPENIEQWLKIAFEAVILAGFTLGFSWITFAILAFVMQHAIRRPLASLRRSIFSYRSARDARRAARDDEHRRRIAQAEFERTAPERERARLQAEADARVRADAQRRRDDARASALLSFSFYSAKLGSRFSREMFDQYVREYMGDEHSADVVARRGQELIAIFERHLADVQPPKKQTTIESLTKWFSETKAQIEALPLDDSIKEPRLIELEVRYNELLAAHLEGTAP